jgi:hypothetical protein
VVAPYPQADESGPDWAFGSLVGLMVPAVVAAAAVSGGAFGTGRPPDGGSGSPDGSDVGESSQP